MGACPWIPYIHMQGPLTSLVLLFASLLHAETETWLKRNNTFECADNMQSCIDTRNKGMKTTGVCFYTFIGDFALIRTTLTAFTKCKLL